MDCYIYYKSSSDISTEIIAEVGKISAVLAQKCLAQPLLQTRFDTTGDLLTWMEVYKAVDHQFLPILNDLISHSALPHLIKGERHVEFFIDAVE
jgi:hypothetical protein